MSFLRVLCIATLVSAGAHASPPMACAIPGEILHWQADYCMAEVGTDDIIAAGACLEREAKARFASDCSAKSHYKRGMCERAVDAEAYAGTVDACVRDAGFVGSTVRNGGA